MSPTRIEHLKKVIRDAFADVPYPGNDNIGCNTRSTEAQAIRRNFQGKHWSEVPREALAFHHADLWYFSDAAEQFYLPAYLFAALDDYWNIVDFLTYHFAPKESQKALDAAGEDGYRSRFEGYTPAQKNAVKLFLEYVRDELTDTGLSRHAQAALDYYWGRDWV